MHEEFNDSSSADVIMNVQLKDTVLLIFKITTVCIFQLYINLMILIEYNINE
jgi:hypothetical protein